MNKRFYLLITTFVFFFLISFVNAQNTDISGSDDEKEIPAKSIVRGRVFYADTGKPMRRGWVGLVKVKIPEQDLDDTSDFLENFNPSSGSSSGYVLTDDNGEFLIKDLEAGTYYPTFKVAGVLNPEAFNREYKNLEISLEEFDQLFQKITVDGYNEIQINIGARRGGAISGRISYSDGEPAVGMRVEAIRKIEGEFESVAINEYGNDTEGVVSITTTDDTGFYRFAGLPLGEYIVRISEPSIHRADDLKANKWDISKLTRASELKTYFPDAVNPKYATSLKVNLSQELSNINIILPDRRLFNVSGIIIAKDNKTPFKYAQISFDRRDLEDIEETVKSEANNITADEQGRWAFKDLPVGKYSLTIKPPYNYNKEESNKTEYAKITKEIEIKGNDLQNIVIELPIASSISGTIIFEDIKEVTELFFVYASDNEKSLSSFQTFNKSDENESINKSSYNFQLKSLSEGSFFIRASCIDKCYPKSIILGDKDYLAAPIELKDGQNISGLKIVLATDIGTLKGTVRNNQNNPAEFTNLLLIPADSGKLQAAALYRHDKTNKDGKFQINAAPGEYFIVFPQNEDYEMKQDERLEKWTKNAERVTIKSNETTTINLSFPN